ncbi:hypothetical protein [Sphingomonas sp. 37zxx]|uniref:hypothetical protein n=1 Tax=Sphingomonas sp. 37zxx TaxID=1550073 RepID=UPI000B0365D9|nr:hypothetical protein [Sphingomonas sp. 37zxx]
MLGCAVAWSLSACGDKVPSGQVVAVANGEEITLGELRAEAAARSRGPNAEAVAPPVLLREVIDRKLWAQEARRAKLDQQIEFVLARRRAEERLLMDLQLRRIGNAVMPLSDAEIDQILRKDPGAFASYTVFQIDQIDAPLPPGGTAPKRLSNAGSLAEVDRLLTQAGLVGQRSRTEWNSRFMSAALADRLRQLPPDKLFFHRNGDTLIAATVIDKTDVALSRSNRRILARQSLGRQNIDSAINQELEALRAAADIRLQPGFTVSDGN